MNVTIFDLYPQQKPTASTGGETHFLIPTLPAYAIEYSVLQLNGVGGEIASEKYEINEEKIIIKAPLSLGQADRLRLVIYYLGIRDYALLFPQIKDLDLKKRMALFYRDAELAFENALWPCYAVMCGAIFQGILFTKLSESLSFARLPFQKLIEKAIDLGIIDTHTADVMEVVRNFRNVVHANKFEEPCINRADAMDIKLIMDKLIRES
ncbi:MAG: hypothetical protein HQK57_09905 [Deltaproteobacteria bacterium]|nr:hypothetical protein [Deltaproteobacteria bacterium]